VSDESPPPNSNVEKGILFLMQMQGGLVCTPELAVQIAEALCEAHSGKDELARQKPFISIDKGDHWRVEGSWNRDGKLPGKGNFFLSIDKYDGRVTDIGTWLRNPEGDEFLKEVMAAKTPEENNAIVMKRFRNLPQDEEKNK
jgi:hypothetical protein